jgi:nicotinic acid mononucleotide adenylyltransferase
MVLVWLEKKQQFGKLKYNNYNYIYNMKLKFEPYYNKLSENIAISTGYFEPTHDEINWNEHVNLPCTPINFLRECNDIHKPAILISTGAHCPMHKGHISIMTNAKKSVEQAGYTVIGGYLSPGHDEYINQKLGNDAMNISKRMQWANNLLNENKNNNWLAIDPWEGVFAPGAVNFTSVVYRLQLYIKKFYKHAENVKIFFVCGDDNARFMVPFENTDIGTVIATRPNYEEIRLQYKNVSTTNNVIFADSGINTSSTEVRKSKEYTDFKNTKDVQAIVRLKYDSTNHTILNILREYYSNVWPQYIDKQITSLKFTDFKYPIINMDSEIDLGTKLEISRLYDNFGQKQLGYTNRPGSKDLETQFYDINSQDIKEYYLFDDDIFTGSTMKYVEKCLSNFNILIKGRLSFISGNTEHEVVDIKDFLMYDGGGLVTKIDNELVRIPYIYPFVDPSTRASIKNPLQFSIDMWKQSENYYYNVLTPPILIGEHEHLRYLIQLGFNANTSMQEVCAYYYTFLTKIKNYEL